MTRTKIHHLLNGALLPLLIIALFAGGVPAQKGTHITRRVKFARGQNSTTIKGSATWGTSYIYLLHARAGQTLTVSVEGVPVFRIVPPGARNYEALEGADNVKEWSGRLPRTGTYQINVGHADDAYADAPYELKISVQ